MMRRTHSAIALVLILVTLTGMVACASGSATTPVGKAVQAADVQKRLVEAAALEFAKAHLCSGLDKPECQGRPALTAKTYEQGKAAYQKWAASESALAGAIATAKAVQSADNDAKVQTALSQMMLDVNAYLGLVSAFVDVPALRKKVEK